MARPERLLARARGLSAERRAAWLLRLKGYRILERGFRPARAHGMGEVDIVARRGRTIVFVEVKARESHAAAAFAVGRGQQERIARAARHFLKTRPIYEAWAMRFDVMALEAGRFWPVHLKDAWRA